MLRRLLLIIGSILFSILLAEVLARVIFPKRYYLKFPNVEHVVEFDQEQVSGVWRTSHFRVNSLGLRGSELQKSDQLRILALGGSTTEVSLMDQPLAWPQIVEDRLEKSLNQAVWVGNAGKSSLDSRHHVIALDYYLSSLPELNMVIILVGINDLLFRLGQGEQYDPDWSSQAVQEGLLEETFEFMMPNPSQADHPLKRWHLYQLARRVKQQLIRPNEQIRATVGQFYQSRRQERFASEKIDALPDLTEALEAYKDNLKRLIAMAKEHSVEIVLMTQPVLWQKNISTEYETLFWMGKATESPITSQYYAVSALEEGMRRYNEALLEVCQIEDIKCIDLDAQIPRTTEFFYDDVHYTEAGSAKVASVIFDYLINQFHFSGNN